MQFHFDYTLTEFTPGEAEHITGLTTAMQRDWRRRKFLPSGNGHARFDVFGLAEMMFLKVMADRGIGPHQMSDIADLAGCGIALGALLSDAAYEGDAHPSGDLQRAMSVISKTSKHVVRRVQTPRYLILWADGTEYWDSNVQEAIDALSDDEIWTKASGPMIVIDQWMLGGLLLKRALRPFVHVERVEE